MPRISSLYGEQPPDGGTPPEREFRCDRCDEMTLASDERSDDRGNSICEQCSEYFRECSSCGTVVHENDAMHSDWDTYCYDCFRDRYSLCEVCDEDVRTDDMRHYDNISVCEGCADYYVPCDGHRCNYAFHENQLGRLLIHDENSGHYYCRYCMQSGRGPQTRTTEGRPMPSRLHYELLSGTERTGGFTFGLEIEAEWGRRRVPFRMGGYHSGHPAPPEHFYHGWRCERDGSLRNGCEVISPVLIGAAGVAESIAAAGTVSDMGGRVPSSCGQHITTCVIKPEERVQDAQGRQVRTQLIAAILEDALIASTGSFTRWNGHHYCRRLKSFPMSSLSNREGVHFRTSVAGLKMGHLLEFRYPPGVLTAEQIALNIGLTQCVLHMGAEMEWDEVLERFEEIKTILRDSGRSQMEKAHASVMFGLNMLVEQGWHTGGAMTGLPYDPTLNTSVILNPGGDRVNTVELPRGGVIMTRFKRSVGNFYNRMSGSYGYSMSIEDVARMVEEAKGALNVVQSRLEVA